MRTIQAAACLMTAALLASCNTYYDPSDPYTRGLRWYDRGSHSMAQVYWEPLVAAGDCDAKARTSLMRYEDAQTPAARLEAVALMKETAQSGHPLAQLLLGALLLENGIPIHAITPVPCDGCNLTPDPVEGTKWLLLGQRNAIYDGQRQMAAYYLDKAKARLTPEQFAEAESRAKAWQPEGPVCKPRHLW